MRLWQVIKAVLAAFIGVQSEKNRQLDFQAQTPLPYIITGIILVVLFVLCLVLIVNYLVAF
ncbi:DUF2970 domain-containing protein [Marinomonas agarivorans]|nr:DUF2970 domain-containing protein [Marinomonas agarivorans]